MPEICVVITSYNYGRFLEEAIQSATAQTFRDREIVVVDDGSDEPDTIEALASVERPGVRLLRTAHRGAAAARNTGVTASKAPLICCLDADDQLHPEYLEVTHARLRNDHQHRLGFVTTWLRKFGLEEDVWHARPYSPLDLALTCTVHATSLFRREAWEAVDGYRESFPSGEDWNFWVGIVAAGYEWAAVERELLHYRRHGPSRSEISRIHRTSLFEAIVRDNDEFYRKHHPSLLAKLYQIVVELELVWSEKDQALVDNRILSSQLAEEKAGHGNAVAAHRELEQYCQELLEQVALKSQAVEAAGNDFAQLETNYRELKQRYEELVELSSE